MGDVEPLGTRQRSSRNNSLLLLSTLPRTAPTHNEKSVQHRMQELAGKRAQPSQRGPLERA